MLFISNNKGYVDGLVWELTFTQRLYKHFLWDQCEPVGGCCGGDAKPLLFSDMQYTYCTYWYVTCVLLTHDIHTIRTDVRYTYYWYAKYVLLIRDKRTLIHVCDKRTLICDIRTILTDMWYTYYWYKMYVLCYAIYVLLIYDIRTTDLR